MSFGTKTIRNFFLLNFLMMSSVWGIKRELIIRNFKYNFNKDFVTYQQIFGPELGGGYWYNSTTRPREDIFGIYLNVSLRTEDKNNPKSRKIFAETINLCKPVQGRMFLLRSLFFDEYQEQLSMNFDLRCPYRRDKTYKVRHKFPRFVEFPKDFLYRRLFFYGSVYMKSRNGPERILALNFNAIYQKLNKNKKDKLDLDYYTSY